MQIYTVDAFTATPFRGNPAAVCILREPRDDAWRALVAREMNLSETAFLEQAEHGWKLRWFTPAVEVDLCGHATLASAHILWQEGLIPSDSTARFHTRSGDLHAALLGDGRIELDFPALPPAECSRPGGPEPPIGLVEALRCPPPEYVGWSRFDSLVQLAGEADVRALEPDLARLPKGVRGVIVTARGEGEFDFVSRFFAPGAGIDEDPVTGSAHCVLGPFWSERLSKTAMHAYQASARGGVVDVEVRGERVALRGNAVTMLRATLDY
jgi:PhzF family phenazine biosynthesis protein